MTDVPQRYVKAVGSGNLKNDDKHSDTDVLAAVAMSSTLGGLLYRVKYFNDAPSYKRLLDQWTWIVSTKAVRRTWPENIPIDRVAALSLNRWINDVCPACTGLAKVKVFNTPTLSDKDCPMCDGSGKAPLRVDKRWRDYVLDMIEELFAMELRAAARARRKLRYDPRAEAAIAVFLQQYNEKRK